MQRIIVFRFHRDLFVCRNRLRALRHLNPEIPVFGLFGGTFASTRVLNRARTRPIARYLEDVCYLPGRSWADHDLAVRYWFEEYGNDIRFDVAYLIEWDMLLFAPISELYDHVSPRALGLTGLTPLKAISDRWSWVTREAYRRELAELMDILRKEYSFSGEPFACVGPGASFPRAFLDRYASIRVPRLCHDEVRLPTLAKALGFDLQDTGFFKRWFDEGEERIFNADRREIEERVIENELAQATGRRVFHPYFRVLENGNLLDEISGREQAPPGRRRREKREEAVEKAVARAVRLARSAVAYLWRRFVDRGA